MADTRFNINSNEYLPLRDVVFNTLRDAILTGKLVPGERLMENQLAEKLGVSRTPVREALRMLELENLVELVPRKGAQEVTIFCASCVCGPAAGPTGVAQVSPKTLTVLPFTGE